MAQDVTKYDKKLLKQMLNEMMVIRRFEEKAAQMYGLRKIGGFCHIYIGQEAVCTGATAALDLKKDYVLTAYRDHGHAISAGMEPNIVMAELYGKASGCSKAKGGSMHMFDAEKHFFGGNGIVGAHIPLAAGVAMKIKYRREDGVVLCFFGDGAIHQGSFHETLNMASVWKLPVIYICENNQYGMGTDFRRVSAVHDFSKMAGSYNMPGRQINGMDVLEVYDAISEGVKQVRKDKTPQFFEAVTYRYLGHSMSDPGTYRKKDEVKKKREVDPIAVLKRKMIDAELLTDKDYDKMDDKAKKIAAESVKYAEDDKEPAVETLYEDVLI